MLDGYLYNHACVLNPSGHQLNYDFILELSWMCFMLR